MTTEAVPGSPPEGTAAPEGVEVPAGESPAPETQETDADRNWRQVREQIGKLQESEAKLQKERDSERFEREKLRRQLDELQKQAVQKVYDDPGKTLDDFFGDTEKFTEYVTRQAEQKAEQAGRAAAEKLEFDRLSAQYDKKLTEYAKENPGYQEAEGRVASLGLHREVVKLLYKMEDGPAVVEYLGNNITDAFSLRDASLADAGMLLERLGSRIKSEREKAAAAKKEPPPPPAPKLDGGTGSGGSVKPDSPDSDSLSDAEWARRRNAQEAARRRR